jgi:hypothetical protein
MNGSPLKRWGVVVLFALAMAWMESATVLYLRTLVGRIDPYQAMPLPPHPVLGNVELIRELATLLMLSTVGWLAGRDFRTRFSYTLIAFGIWDIFYYVFLAMTSPWPKSVMDWDVLFLIPLPWWGPVLAPCLIAGLMVIGGTMVTQFEGKDGTLWPSRASVWLNWAGIALALYVFMQDAIRVAPRGEDALRKMLPERFDWSLFVVSLLLMSVSLIELTCKVWRARGQKPAIPEWKAVSNLPDAP